MDEMPNYATLSGLLESMDLNDDPQFPEGDRRYSGRPDSPSVIPSLNDEVASLSTSLTPTPPTMSKRTHALLELLSSERAYASDLALIRDVHIPCALGQPAPFNAHPVTPPSSGSSSRTLSTASDSSTSSSQMGPPMTREDTKIIFSNVAELALFSDLFVERLEEALGSVLDGGIGDDHVGALFVEIIPAMEPPYKTYITRHPAALSHLHSLPPSSALTAYLNHSKTLATSLTHAWDLPSLLIKPVQRLLKYSLLLTAIIAETPDTHPDKENLKLAREKMEDVARAVNEDRRRWEVVKEVLNTKPGEGKGKKGLSVPASVNISRMKSLRSGKEKEDNHEAEQVERMEKLLKRSDAFINQFAKEAVDWAATVKVTVRALKQWAVGFAQVIGLSEEQKSEAFDAFVVVVEEQLTPLSGDLESIIHKKLLVDLARLVDSMRAPLRLLEAMNTLEPLHYGLLNINFAKGRPPTALLEASQSYLALRGQLFSELPQYLRLLDKGIATSIMQLAHWQTSYWADVHDRWGGLWDALRVDGEMNAGAAETSRVWWGRWSEVASVITGLNIVNPKKIYVEKPMVQPPPDRIVSMLASLNSGYIPQVPTPSPTSPSHSRSLKNGHKQSGESVRSGKSGKSKSSKHSRPTEDFNDYAYISMLGPMPMLTPIPSSAQTSLQSPGVRQSVSSGSSRTIPLNRRSSDAQDYSDQRGRPARKSSLTQKMSKSFRSSRSSSRRSSSRKSIEATPPPLGITTFYTGGSATVSRPGRHSVVSSTCSPSRSLQTARAMYACRVVHPCNPPDGVSYRNLPFFTLRVNTVFEVLEEYGHPSLHEDLPLYVDDGEDCLLLVRDIVGNIGWSLASFLIPLD
ncbi:hypothetical protein PILCRDRAFT_77630 [Piloderma croceum F 1598]|uniref:DH domain-containing protein n=1 Tax=Piloderma croceum (strain F 1598) TaxID=765440 RepID=A0A0C3ARV0_PILCF|nr:hypothetical protein PILCRDRAFT_77630 [Piloderma croceum F 1598]